MRDNELDNRIVELIQQIYQIAGILITNWNEPIKWG